MPPSGRVKGLVFLPFRKLFFTALVGKADKWIHVQAKVYNVYVTLDTKLNKISHNSKKEISMTCAHWLTQKKSINKLHLFAESIKALSSIISIPTSYKVVTHACKAYGPSCFIYSGISGYKFNSCKPQQWKPCSHMSHMTTSVTIVTCFIIINISQQRAKVSQRKCFISLLRCGQWKMMEASI